ncbi:MAG TPA: FmdB family zinc ribbon protein [Anaeromyxobacteraceae bacterium]|nr:FmdB family zinc ribbon protein [Anaeromyxobacteraceae bacterium]
MPLYEYECPKCGRFDALQKLSDPPLDAHDLCGAKVRKLMSASAFAFKGSGFYATDYAGKGAACASATPEKKGEKSEACASCPNRAA